MSLQHEKRRVCRNTLKDFGSVQGIFDEGKRLEEF